MKRPQIDFHDPSRRHEFVLIGLLTLVICFGTSLQASHDTITTDSYPVHRVTKYSPHQAGQPVRMTAEILSQRYCRDTALKTFTIIFKLRMSVINQSGTNLIVEKTPGLGLYSIVVAHDAKSLSERKYEYEPYLDMKMESLGPETPERFKSPGPDFAILAPGESLHSEKEIWAPFAGRLQGLDQAAGFIPAGDHVLRVTFSTWDFQTEPKEIRKRWEPFGYLVYEDISTPPLPFTLPSDPKLENCK